MTKYATQEEERILLNNRSRDLARRLISGWEPQIVPPGSTCWSPVVVSTVAKDLRIYENPNGFQITGHGSYGQGKTLLEAAEDYAANVAALLETYQTLSVIADNLLEVAGRRPNDN